MWNRCAFTVADREYLWKDVMLAAMWRGDWLPFELRLRQGLACETCSYEEDDPADQDAVDSATTEFRYAHELITAEETERWLERMGLSVDAWSRFFARQNLLTRWAHRLDAIHAAYPPDEAAIVEHLLAEGICSGRFRAMAKDLAGRAAVAAASADVSAIGASPVDDERVRDLLDRHGFLLMDDPAEEVQQRLTHIAWLDAVFEAARNAAITEEAVRAQVEASRLDWIVVHLERLSFPEESMVRETLLCCQEDDLSLGQLASRIKRMVRTEQVRLEDSAPDLRALLLSAAPGALLGPVAGDDEFHAMVVREKRLPSADDPEVRTLAESAVVSALQRRARVLHVQWKHGI